MWISVTTNFSIVSVSFENHWKGFQKMSFKNYLQKIKYDRPQSYLPHNEIVLLVTFLAGNFMISVAEQLNSQEQLFFGGYLNNSFWSFCSKWSFSSNCFWCFRVYESQSYRNINTKMYFDWSVSTLKNTLPHLTNYEDTFFDEKK